jgi:hypothetical protein
MITLALNLGELQHQFTSVGVACQQPLVRSHDPIDDGQPQTRAILAGMIGAPVPAHEIAKALHIKARPLIADTHHRSRAYEDLDRATGGSHADSIFDKIAQRRRNRFLAPPNAWHLAIDGKRDHLAFVKDRRCDPG